MSHITAGAFPAQRHAFVVNVRPDLRDRYLELHAAVWPHVEQTLSAQGITNYSIFLLDDTLFGYYEYRGADYEADMAIINADAVTQHWLSQTGPCQTVFGTADPGVEGWREAHAIWHLP